MHYYLVAPTVVVRKNETVFTYQSEATIAIGTVVRFSLGKKEAIGIVMAPVSRPEFATKPISALLIAQPLPQQLLQLATWLAEYYATPLPIVLQSLLPTGLYKKRRRLLLPTSTVRRARTRIVLNDEQGSAVSRIINYRTGTLLLHGVTGSGKTQVYIEAAQHEYRSGRSSIVIVPEITLTPQFVAEFSQHFKSVVVTHSQMSEAERHQAWLTALESNEHNPLIVIGPRSALFMPIAHLGLIVVDECHEPSLKQEQAPRYSALRVASMLARFHNAKALVGSATPTVVDYYLATSSKSPVLLLSKTATSTSQPRLTLLDCKQRDNFREHRFISDELLAATRQALANKKQVLIFHNRRGTAPTTLCSQCGWIALCDYCHVPLTLHADRFRLLCHLCGRHKALPTNCPQCGQPDVTFKGIGTKLIADEIRKLFPKARIARFDADNAKDETLSARYQELYDGDIDIIIGTQLLAKGLDLPHLRVVGIIQADSGLQLPDYQAEERVFQLLYQVAGRVGRGKHSSQVIIQTYQPEHPIIQLALARNYSDFYQQQLAERRSTAFPPFVFLLKLTCIYKTEAGAIRAAQATARTIGLKWPKVTVLGPTPAFHERIGATYRWQLLIKSKERAVLVTIAKQMPPHWQADLDPSTLL